MFENTSLDIQRVLEIALSAVIFYMAMILLVRILGKRTTSQMNNFDWLITISVGSLGASGILLRDIVIWEGLIAIAVLALAQFLVTWSVLRSQIVEKIVKASPTLLLHRGELLYENMKRVRVSRPEIVGALRSHGMTRLDDTNWVILETNGEMSVIPRDEIKLSDASTMTEVERPSGLQD